MSDRSKTLRTSRLCFKNLPEALDEHQQRQKLTVETKRGGTKGNSTSVQVTDVKVLRINGKSRRIAFVGFRDEAQAELCLNYWNKAYMGPNRLNVEYAALKGVDEGARPWSKYSAGASNNPETIALHEQRKKESQERAALLALARKAQKNGTLGQNAELSGKLADAGISKDDFQDLQKNKIRKALEMHPVLFGLSPEQREAVLSDSKFHDYISLAVDKRSKDRNFWDNDDQSRETNTLRALYLAKNEESKSNTEEQDDGSTPSFEDVMESLKKDKKKSGADDEHDSDDEEYFDNVAMNDGEEEEDAHEGKEQEEMKSIVQDILKRNVANSKKVTDDDYFAMKSKKAFDSDNEEDGEESEDSGFSEDEQEDVKEDDVKEDSASSIHEEDAIATATSSLKRKSTSDDTNEESEEDSPDAKKAKPSFDISDEEAKAIMRETGKIFVRRLPFTATTDELREIFERYGDLKDIYLPMDINKESKGFAYVTYVNPKHAYIAYTELQPLVFQGRVLHLVPGRATGEKEFDPEKPFAHLGDDEIKKMSYKEKKKLLDRAQAQKGHNWNSLFINADTVANAVAHKFNMKKADLLGADQYTTSDSAGVRMAVAETHLIQETKEFLEKNGVLLDKFTSRPGDKSMKDCSDTVFLIKNIPFDTEELELRKILKKFGPIQRLILPPYRTMCVVEYVSSSASKRAYMGTAYKKFKHVPLFLEWAPKDCLIAYSETDGLTGIVTAPKKKSDSLDIKVAETEEKKEVVEEEGSKTLFVKNVHFDSNEDKLREVFGKLAMEAYPAYVASMRAQGKEITASEWRVRAVSLAKRTVTSDTGLDKGRKIGEILSLGYGFIEVNTPSAARGIAALIEQKKGVALDGHLLDVRVSNKADQRSDVYGDLSKKTILVQKGILTKEKLEEQQEWGKLSSKLIVRNVPFEANAKEIRELFKSFGQLRRVKLPKKADNSSHRGFAFVDFVTSQEAKNAYNALQNTHLFGRHLVLEWAAPDETIQELRDKAKKAVEK